MDALAWDERYRGSELVWTAEPNRFVVAEVSPLPPGRALDLACGEGRNAVWLASRGWQVEALDFSPVAVDKARVLAAHHGVAEALELRVEDLTGWAPTAGSVDLVVLSYLHLGAEDRRKVLVAAWSALAPGGHLVVIGHDATNIDEGFGGPQDPSVLFTAEEIVRDVTSGVQGDNVEVLRAERVTRPVGEGPNRAVALDCLVHLVRVNGSFAER